MNKIVIIILLFLSSFTTSLLAQEVVRSEIIENYNGKDFYLHTVEKGQTIYSIAKAYNVSIDLINEHNKFLSNFETIPEGLILRIPVKKQETTPKEYKKHIVAQGETLYSIAKNYGFNVNDLYQINPGLTTNISIGQEILIPTTKEIQELPHQTTEPTVKDTVLQNHYIIHIVSKGETAYGIAREYAISLQELEELNPLIKNKELSIGMELIIPIYSNNIIAINDTMPECSCDTPKLKEKYNIALLIPLYLEHAYLVEYDKKKNLTSESKFKSLEHVQFYEGLLIAIDSLKKNGFNAVLHTYDVDKDEENLKSIIQKPEFKTMDLIIGPWDDKAFEIVADFAKQQDITIISPASFICPSLYSNPKVIKLVPDVPTQLLGLNQYFNNYYPEANVLYVYKSSHEVMKSMEGIIQSVLHTPEDSAVYSYKIVDYSESGFSGITSNFQAGKTNIIVTMMSGEAFLSAYANNLHKIRKNHEIVLFGLPGWFRFDKLDMVHFSNLNTHWFGSSFVDYSRKDVKDFVKEYRSIYEGEPNSDAFLGYDIGLYFFSALQTYGKDFLHCINKKEDVKLLQTEFHFKRISNASGYENQFVNIYRTYKYRLINARIYPYKDYPYEEE